MLSTEFIITSLIVVLIPSTGVIFTISMGLFQGWRSSLIAAIGCTAGIIPHLLATILGLAALLHVSAVAFQIVKFVGVAYLFYLAWGMWKDTGKLNIDKDNEINGGIRIFTRAILINILNPKLSIFFLAFLPQFLPTVSATPLKDMLILSISFMMMTLVVFAFYGLCATSMRTYVLRSPKFIQNIQRSFALVFATLGIKLAFADR